MLLSELLGDDFHVPLVERRCGVVRSDDFERVDALPRAEWPVVLNDGWPLDLRERYTRSFAKGEGVALRDIQARALWAAEQQGGLFAPMGVGSGKTLLTMLLPWVLGSDRAVLFVPAALVKKTERERKQYAQQWTVAEGTGLRVVSYGALSAPKGARLLDDLAPDAIIADEAQLLRHASSVRTKRVGAYLDANPGTRFCALSGSITSRSLADFAHLARWALRMGAPVPLRARTLLEWCEAIDEGVDPELRRPGGVLETWCEPGEHVRDGFRRRLISTPGVVATTDPAVLGVGLTIATSKPRDASAIAQAIRQLHETGHDADNNQCDSDLDVARIERQLACGFWYRWQWPNGIVDTEWLTARNRWRARVRLWLATNSSAGCDSPMLLAKAIDDGRVTGGVPGLVASREAWLKVADRPEPGIAPVWFSDATVQHAIEWTNERDAEPGIVWVEHEAVGVALAERGLPWFGAGTEPDTSDAPTIACSIRAHGVGKNLQARSRNLIVTAPASGAAWEQLLGRTHRPGQRADDVSVTVLQHAPALRSALAQARRDADYLSAVTGQPQKLQLATWVV